MDAYLTGLEQALDAGIDLTSIQSVASFFVSRVDTEVDKRLEAIGTRRGPGAARQGRGGQRTGRVRRLRGGLRLRALAPPARGAGANRQRPLWASTGVKNPDYDDTMYVRDLVVPETVNTMPEKTLEAFADHGEVLGDVGDRQGRAGARAPRPAR